MSFLIHLLSEFESIVYDHSDHQMLEIDDVNFKYNVSEGLSCRDSSDRPVGRAAGLNLALLPCLSLSPAVGPLCSVGASDLISVKMNGF